MVERFIIHHPKFGRYEQLVYETVEEAGHKPLPSEGKFGWNMPTNQATQEFISKTQGRVVFEIGVGLGDTVVIPVLEEGAAIVYAMDILHKGGFIHPKRGFLKISLYQLMKRPELNRGEENSFLYFDHSTLVGLFERWSKTRKQRMLPTDLELEESYYFSPLSIAKINKLVEEPEFSNMENHVFTLRKS